MLSVCLWTQAYSNINYLVAYRLRAERCIGGNVFRSFYNQVYVPDTYRYAQRVVNTQFTVNAVISINLLLRTRVMQANT